MARANTLPHFGGCTLSRSDCTRHVGTTLDCAIWRGAPRAPARWHNLCIRRIWYTESVQIPFHCLMNQLVYCLANSEMNVDTSWCACVSTRVAMASAQVFVLYVSCRSSHSTHLEAKRGKVTHPISDQDEELFLAGEIIDLPRRLVNTATHLDILPIGYKMGTSH